MSASLVPDELEAEMLVNPREWRSRQHDDPEIGPFVRYVTKKEKPDPSSITSSEGKLLLKEFNHLVIRRGVLYRCFREGEEEKYQLVMPAKYRDIALKGAHNDVGHLGRDRGMTILKERFYWPKMGSSLETWIKECDRCIKRKTPTNMRAPLVSITTSQPLELVCMDFLTLEMSKGGFQYLLIITDHFTRYALAIPTKNMTAKTTADAFFTNFVVHYGFPKRIHSDQGKNFESEIIEELCQLSGMSKSRTTPYHPMGNGMCERFNRTLLNMLGTLEPSQKADWKSEVGALVHSYNCTRHDSTGFSPYLLMFGRQPRLAVDIVLGLSNMNSEEKDYCKYVNELKMKLKKSYELASSKCKSAQKHQKDNYDLKTRGAIVEPGDRVLVKIVAFEGRHKIADRWEDDPYVVLDQPSKDIPVYIVRKEAGCGPKRTLHRNLLLPIGSLPLSKPTDIKVKVKGEPRKPSPKRTTPVESIIVPETEDESSEEENTDFMIIQHQEEPEPTQSSSTESSSVEDTDQDEDVQLPVVPPHGPDQQAHASPSPPPPRCYPQRQRRPPEWIRRNEYAMSHQTQLDKPDWMTKVEYLQLLASDDKFNGLKDNICNAMINVVVGK